MRAKEKRVRAWGLLKSSGLLHPEAWPVKWMADDAAAMGETFVRVEIRRVPQPKGRTKGAK